MVITHLIPTAMKTKKSSSANLESKRFLYREIGMVVALLFLFSLFEYSTKPAPLFLNQQAGILENTDILPPLTRVEQPLVKPILEKPLPKSIVAPDIIETTEIKLDQTNMVMGNWEIHGLDTLSTYDAASNDPIVYRRPEKMPQFPGGEKALMKFVYSHLRYHPDALSTGIQGRVIVGFVVNEKGNVSDVKILHSPSHLLDISALEVARMLPDFEPGEQAGKKVSVHYTLPIDFEIQKKNY